MGVEVSVEIDRPANLVWSVLSDVERWPEWTASMISVQHLDSAPFGIEGSRVRIRQPKLKTMVWRISEYQQGRFFTWEARSPGIFVAARHAVQASGRGCVVTLSVDQKGFMAPLIELSRGGLTRRYVEMEARSLKKRCELESRILLRNSEVPSWRACQKIVRSSCEFRASSFDSLAKRLKGL